MKFKAYKVLTADNRAPNNPNYQYHPASGVTVQHEGEELEMCKSGLHVYKSLKNISVGSFGSIVWEVRVNDKDCICDDTKYACKQFTFIREIEPAEVKDPEWAYCYCRYVRDDPEVRKHITESVWAYFYCYDVRDDPEVRKHIKEEK